MAERINPDPVDEREYVREVHHKGLEYREHVVED